MVSVRFFRFQSHGRTDIADIYHAGEIDQDPVLRRNTITGMHFELLRPESVGGTIFERWLRSTVVRAMHGQTFAILAATPPSQFAGEVHLQTPWQAASRGPPRRFFMRPTGERPA
jgi:hypothetical protein